jgi:aminoglycoside phosphotransferase (APT) family kinase protein
VSVDDAGWIAEITAGTVTSFERVETGSSRGTWLVDVKVDDGADAGLRRLVLRRDTGDGPLSGTELSLAREAVVYAALGDSGVAIPRLVARSPDGNALLVERSSGGADVAAIGDEATRRAVALSFVERLAQLHALDASALDLPGFSRPETPAERGLADLGLWERIFVERVTRPAPLFRWAYRWLRAHAPTSGSRTVVCHGDVGPGNYLFEGDEVTAILDWEFAHLGDPMDDIAWLTVRGHHLVRFGDPGAELARYTELTGTPVDAARVRWYQALVLTRMATACLVALDRSGEGMDRSTYFNLLPLLARLLTPVVAELAGVEVDDPDVPAPGDGTDRAEVMEALFGDLLGVVMPAVEGGVAQRRAAGMASLLLHLQAADRLQPAMDDADLADLANPLRRRPSSYREGLVALDEVVRGEGGDDEALLRYFHRSAVRRARLWPAITSYATPLAPLPA